MSLETEIVDVLDAHAGLLALVADRNYIGRRKSTPTYPNNSISVDRDIINTLEGESSIEHINIQIDIRAVTDAEIRAVAIQIKLAMAQSANNFTSMCTLDDDAEYDEDVQVRRGIMRFSIWQC